MAFTRGPRSLNAAHWPRGSPVRQQLQTDWPKSLQRSKDLRQAGKPCLPGARRSESESNPSGWLRRVRPVVSVECPDAKIGIFINVTPVLSEQGPVFGQRVVDAAAVEKSTLRLGISAGEKPARVPGWMKHQAATSAKNVGTEPANPERKAYNYIGRGYVDVRLNSRKSARRKILLGVAVVTVVCFAGKPAIEVIAVANKKPAGVCGCPRDSLAVTIFREKTCTLQTDLRSAFLSR